MNTMNIYYISENIRVPVYDGIRGLDEDTLAMEDHTNDYNEYSKEDLEVVISIMDMDTTDTVNNSDEESSEHGGTSEQTEIDYTDLEDVLA